MATLETIRTKAGVVVAIVIGISLAAFILGDMFQGGGSFFQGNRLKIGEISVSANSSGEISKFTIDVSSFVDNLDKKHAIYLVAEGNDTNGLFDLYGLGFSSKNKDIVRPVPPTVNIMVNGAAVDIPATPVRSTNANGIVGVDLYEANYSVPSSVSGTPTVTASSNSNDVKISITQPESRTGTAVVKFDYNGVVKTYKVILAAN